MEKHYLLEACVDSVESALSAARGGADRLELCANLMIGGTTPGPALFREIRRWTDIRIHVLIRPRCGDFCYTDHEYAIMRDEVRLFGELGAQGVVIGALRPDGTLNEEQMAGLMEEAGGMSVTLHRAFDVCRDPFAALEQAERMGVRTILTSGQKNVCTQGKELIRNLVDRADGQTDIMVGGGVSDENIGEMGVYTGARTFHMSGKMEMDSPMRYRGRQVSMGIGEQDEFTLWRTDETKIRAAREVLDRLEAGG